MGLHRDGRNPHHPLSSGPSPRSAHSCSFITEQTRRLTHHGILTMPRMQLRARREATAVPESNLFFEDGECPVRRLQQPICGNT